MNKENKDKEGNIMNKEGKGQTAREAPMREINLVLYDDTNTDDDETDDGLGDPVIAKIRSQRLLDDDDDGDRNIYIATPYHHSDCYGGAAKNINVDWRDVNEGSGWRCVYTQPPREGRYEVWVRENTHTVDICSGVNAGVEFGIEWCDAVRVARASYKMNFD